MRSWLMELGHVPDGFCDFNSGQVAQVFAVYRDATAFQFE
jgi:hypothetical protein